MKVCITSQGDTLDSQVDPRFGRCEYFIIVDTDTDQFEAMPNPHAQAVGGAGIQSGQLITEKRASVVLTGNIGPNAFRTLQAAGIGVITGISGSAREALQKYKKGGLKAIDNPSVDKKFGMGSK